MRRSVHLAITILCPHFERPVAATRDGVSERLIDCSDKDRCGEIRDDGDGIAVIVRPAACPVFRGRAEVK